MEDDRSSSDSDTGSTSRMSDGSRVSFDGPQDDEVKGRILFTCKISSVNYFVFVCLLNFNIVEER